MIERFAIIVGAMKSGTTSLFEYLSEHPEIAACKVKEPNFFADDENWAKGLDWYESLWNWQNGEYSFAMEASTNYTKIPTYPNAAERMRSTDREYRIIYIMRDPIKRIESHYRHALVAGWPEGQVDIAQEVHPHLIEVTEYGRQIGEYYRRFKRDDILLLAFERFIRSPSKVLSDICNFLGIEEWRFNGIGKIHNSVRARARSVYIARNMVKKVPAMSVLQHVIPNRTRQMILGAIGKYSKVGDVRIPDRQREKILNILRNDLILLRDEYGFDISIWGIDL